jgi:hypothetical protein
LAQPTASNDDVSPALARVRHKVAIADLGQDISGGWVGIISRWGKRCRLNDQIPIEDFVLMIKFWMVAVFVCAALLPFLVLEANRRLTTTNKLLTDLIGEIRGLRLDKRPANAQPAPPQEKNVFDEII